ncbi:MAG: hypothetical protein HYX34_10270 [Actinobacteria bacterium]|nr:hypothetical protein [Actinomycetota bacterium]
MLVGRRDVVARVAASVLDGAGAIVCGPQGSGRSAVLDAVVEDVAGRGVEPLRVAGAPVAGRAAPFAGLRSLVPAVERDPVSRLLALRRGVDELVALGEGNRPLLVVDDLDLLDSASLAFVHRALLSEQVALLGAVRTDRPAPEGAMLLWKDGLVDRLDLGPLERRDADRLVEDLVGGPVQASSRERIWGLTAGNPSHIVETVCEQRDRGGWVELDGLWRLAADDVGAPSFEDVLASRLAEAPPAVRELVDVLAVAGLLTLAAAERIVPFEAVAEAERRKLVAVEAEPGGLALRLTHPLVAETRRRELDESDRTRLWGAVAGALLGLDELSGDMLLTAALACLETGADGPEVVDLLVRAGDAASAARAWALVERCGWRAWELSRDSRGLALALNGAGIAASRDEVVDRFDEHWAACADDEQRFVVLNTTGIHLFHRRNQPEDALRLLHDHPLDEPRWAGMLATYEARLHAFLGDLDRSEELCRRHLDHPDPLVAADAEVVLVASLMARGRGHDAVALAEDGFAKASDGRLGTEGPTVAAFHYLFRLSALVDLGRLVEGVDGALAVEPAVAAETDPTGHGWLALHLGRAWMLRGRPRTAARWFRESMACYSDLARPGWRVWPAAGLVACLAASGRGDDAVAARVSVDATPPHPMHKFEAEAGRLLAWHDAVAPGWGGLDGALSRLCDVAARAESFGDVGLAIAAWHDVARFGGADRAAGPLATLVAPVQGDLFPAHADQAAALAARDPAALAGVARRYEAMAAELDAAETWAAVATASSGREASSAQRRAAALAAACEGARTPLLGKVAGASPLPPLTPREAEIVDLLVAGASRQEIADRFVLSVRTVDSHLQRIYRKVGVRTATELIDAVDRASPA